MKLKTIFVVMAFSLVANISLAFDGPQINWFNATSPAERNGQQVLLEWNLSGGARSLLEIDCETGKIDVKDPALSFFHQCGTALNYNSGQGTYALALYPKNNQQWANVLFSLSLLNNDGIVADKKSFSVGFQPTKYFFDKDLYFGLINNEGVRALQSLLNKLNLYQGPVNGNFFAMTLSAVKKYQKENGLKNTGFVGLFTRKALNQLQ